MTATLIPAAPQVLTPTAHRPGAVIAGYVARRAGRSGLLWGIAFAVFTYAQILAYTATYPTQAARDQLQQAFGSNVGSNALIGPVRAINTVAGFTSWRILGILSLLGAVWGLLTSTRLMRGEEDNGRYELLLAGPTTRRQANSQAVLGLGAALAALFAATALGTVLTGQSASVGFTVGQSLYLALTLVASAAVFLSVGAVTSQLAHTRRRAVALAGAVFGVCYAVRMVADSNPRLHWIVWLSPLGWIEQSRPLTQPNLWALLPVLTLIVVATTAAAHLAGARDLGAATLPTRDSSPPRLTLLTGATGLAVRLMRPVALGWLLTVAAFSLLIGVIAKSSTNDSTASPGIEQSLGRLGGHGSLVEDYLGLTFLAVALMIATIAAGQITAIRTEEREGRLDNLLVRPRSRASWLAARLGLSTVLIFAAGALAGFGAWAGAASQHSGVRLSQLLAAGLNVVPPALFLLGLGALALGAWPRRVSAIVYGYLLWAVIIEVSGAVVNANHWLMDTSVFFHMVPAPATTPNWASAATITGLGLAGALAGGFLLNRRDVLGA